MTEIYGKLENEILTLIGLSVINLIMAALTIALGVNIATTAAANGIDGVGNIVVLIGGVLIGGITFAIAIYWILSVVTVFEGVIDVKESLEQKKNEKTDDSITSIIVQLMATYREKKPTLELMNKISKLVGILFIAGGILQLFDMLVVGYINDQGQLVLIPSIVVMILPLAMGAACLLLSKYYAENAAEWDMRLAKSDSMADSLENITGGGQ